MRVGVWVGARRRRSLTAWHLLAVSVAILASAAVGYGIKTAAPVYLESGTLTLTTHKALKGPNGPFLLNQSLTTTGEVMVESLSSPQSLPLVRQRGGDADLGISLVNYNNEDFPDYGYPFAILTAQSTSSASAHSTFTAAFHVMKQLLADRQSQVGVKAKGRIFINVVGDTGVVAQSGSSKRIFSALSFLCLVAAYLAWRLVDHLRGRRAVAPRRAGWT
jgi:hypothetical protein